MQTSMVDVALLFVWFPEGGYTPLSQCISLNIGWFECGRFFVLGRSFSVTPIPRARSPKATKWIGVEYWSAAANDPCARIACPARVLAFCILDCYCFSLSPLSSTDRWGRFKCQVHPGFPWFSPFVPVGSSILFPNYGPSRHGRTCVEECPEGFYGQKAKNKCFPCDLSVQLHEKPGQIGYKQLNCMEHSMELPSSPHCDESLICYVILSYFVVYFCGKDQTL